ncbi:MAG: hypothetical protein ACRD29_13495 [Acidimicrobiales bacterium]
MWRDVGATDPRGTFSDDGNRCVGAWVYPGGGGYESSMTRI